MKSVSFKKIDAFATHGSAGNPAGYVHLDRETDITDSEMLAIAKELKGFVNEVGFLSRISEHHFNLKYYSSEREVDFCGHATVGIMYDVINSDESLRDRTSIQIRTSKGDLDVENRIADEDAVFIMSPLPVEKKMNLYADEIQSALNMNGGTIDTALPIKFIDAGLATLLVPVKNLTEILRICPDIEVLKAFCLRSGIDIIEVFTNDVADPSNDFRTRVFAPTFGYLEDPATGSGNSALGYYLLSKNLFARDTIAIEQNGSKESFNRVKLRKKPDENGVARIWFGGGAVTRLAGDYFLY